MSFRLTIVEGKLKRVKSFFSSTTSFYRVIENNLSICDKKDKNGNYT